MGLNGGNGLKRCGSSSFIDHKISSHGYPDVAFLFFLWSNRENDLTTCDTFVFVTLDLGIKNMLFFLQLICVLEKVCLIPCTSFVITRLYLGHLRAQNM